MSFYIVQIFSPYGSVHRISSCGPTIPLSMKDCSSLNKLARDVEFYMFTRVEIFDFGRLVESFFGIVLYKRS